MTYILLILIVMRKFKVLNLWIQNELVSTHAQYTVHIYVSANL